MYVSINSMNFYLVILHYTQTSMKNKNDDKGHGCQKMSNNISKKIKTKNAIKIKIKIYSLKVI